MPAKAPNMLTVALAGLCPHAQSLRTSSVQKVPYASVKFHLIQRQVQGQPAFKKIHRTFSAHRKVVSCINICEQSKCSSSHPSLRQLFILPGSTSTDKSSNKERAAHLLLCGLAVRAPPLHGRAFQPPRALSVPPVVGIVQLDQRCLQVSAVNVGAFGNLLQRLDGLGGLSGILGVRALLALPGAADFGEEAQVLREYRLLISSRLASGFASSRLTFTVYFRG
jgi:hypothetical protein